MLRKLFLLIVMSYVFICLTRADVPSTEGTRFWVTFMDNSKKTGDLTKGEKNAKELLTLYILLSSRYDGKVDVVNPNMDWDTSVYIRANEVKMIPISHEIGYILKDHTIDSTGILVESSCPISVFAYNYLTNSSSYDATIILPEYSLGTQYIVQVPDVPTDDGTYKKEVVVLATEDDTNIEVKLTRATSKYSCAPDIGDGECNGVITIPPLKKGQTYLINSTNDFSGSHIISNKPIAVFGGHQCAVIGQTTKPCDHLFEQIMPIKWWGKHFVVTRTSKPLVNTIKITTSKNNTDIYVNDTKVKEGLKADTTYSWTLTEDSCYIKTSEPVECFLYLVSNGGGTINSSNGDPSMVHISPIEQQIRKISFSAKNTGNLSMQYVNIVTTKQGAQNMQKEYHIEKEIQNNVVKEDGTEIIPFESFKPIGRPDEAYYYYTRIKLLHPGVYTLSTPYDGFTGYAYGIGYSVSYAYNFGSATYNLDAKILVDGELHEYDKCYEERCPQKPISFSPSMNVPRTDKDTFIWNFGDNTEEVKGENVVHKFNLPGMYRVRLVIKDEISSDTAYTILCFKDLVRDTLRVSICEGKTYIFNGETFSQEGSFNRTISQEESCDTLITILISFLNAYHDTINEEICFGENYFFDGNYYSTTGQRISRKTLPNDCDSIVVLNLKVKQEPIVIDTTGYFPKGNSYEWHRGTYSASGTYHDTIRTQSGPICDSIIYNFHLIGIDVPERNNEEDITCLQQTCFNKHSFTIPEVPDNFEGGDSLYNVYYIEYRDSNLCTVYYKKISFPKLIHHNSYDTVQIGSEYWYRGQVYIAHIRDTLIKSVQHGSNCPFTYDTLFLTGVPFPFIKQLDTLCQKNDTIFWRGRAITSAGMYDDNIESLQGIDSIFRITVVDNRSWKTIYVNATGSFIWSANKQEYTESGVYNHVLINAKGCDSILTLYLGINEKCTITSDVYMTICENTSIEWHEQHCDEEKEYVYKTESAFGCDSIVKLHLSFGHPKQTNLGTISMCRNTFFIYKGDTLRDEGDVTYTFKTSAGCDSVVTFTIKFFESSFTQLTDYLRPGRKFYWDGSFYTKPGTYSKYYTNSNECDSIVTLTLQTFVPHRDTLYDTICLGEKLSWRNKIYTREGWLVDSSDCSELGCDSFHYLSLTVGQARTIERFFSINSHNEVVIFSPGNLQFNYLLGTHNVWDADDFQTGSWRFAEHQWDYIGDMANGTVTIDGERCDNTKRSETYNGWIDLFGWGSSGYNGRIPYLSTSNPNDYGVGSPNITNTKYDWGLYNQIGKDAPRTWRTLSKEEWNYLLTQRPNAASLCGHATVNDIPGLLLLPDNWTPLANITFTPGLYNDYATNIYPIDLWELLEKHGAVFLPAAGYMQEGNVYHNDDRNGMYWSTSFDNNENKALALQCANADISIQEHNKYEALSVRLVQPITPFYYDTICQGDTLVWTVNHKPYTQTGIYDTILKSQYNCDSMVSLHLTVNPVYRDTTRKTICQGDTFYWQDNPYFNTTFVHKPYYTIVGCDSSKYLQLTVNPQYEQTTSRSICNGDTFLWEINKQKYTESGVYSYLERTIHGCDSLLKLNLQVFDTFDIYIQDTLCQGDTLVWNNSLYTKEGTYQQYLQTKNLCDSIVTLHLTLLPSYHKNLNDTILFGQTYSFNNQQYNRTGTYKHHLYTVNGCDSLVSLHLRVVNIQWSVNTNQQCADDPYVILELRVTGDTIDSFLLTFSPKAQAQFFNDTLIQVGYDYNLVRIPNKARAGIYPYSLTPLNVYGNNHTKTDSFTLLYPSSVLDQHWNDFIAVFSSKFNGGYDFVSYQWYKNNILLPGENKSYLVQPLEVGSMYSALLEQKDGTKLMTCNLIIENKDDIYPYPILLKPHQPINIQTTQVVSVEIYTITGNCIYTKNISDYQSSIPAPKEYGVYIIKMRTLKGKIDVRKIIVQ